MYSQNPGGNGHNEQLVTSESGRKIPPGCAVTVVFSDKLNDDDINSRMDKLDKGLGSVGVSSRRYVLVCGEKVRVKTEKAYYAEKNPLNKTHSPQVERWLNGEISQTGERIGFALVARDAFQAQPERSGAGVISYPARAAYEPTSVTSYPPRPAHEPTSIYSYPERAAYEPTSVASYPARAAYESTGVTSYPPRPAYESTGVTSYPPRPAFESTEVISYAPRPVSQSTSVTSYPQRSVSQSTRVASSHATSLTSQQRLERYLDTQPLNILLNNVIIGRVIREESKKFQSVPGNEELLSIREECSAQIMAAIMQLQDKYKMLAHQVERQQKILANQAELASMMKRKEVLDKELAILTNNVEPMPVSFLSRRHTDATTSQVSDSAAINVGEQGNNPQTKKRKVASLNPYALFSTSVFDAKRSKPDSQSLENEFEKETPFGVDQRSEKDRESENLDDYSKDELRIVTSDSDEDEEAIMILSNF